MSFLTSVQCGLKPVHSQYHIEAGIGGQYTPNIFVKLVLEKGAGQYTLSISFN